MSAFDCETYRKSIIEAAASYAQRGWRVIPLYSSPSPGVCSCKDAERCLKPGKHPIEPVKPYDKATSDPARARSIFAEMTPTRLYNIGIVTGRASDLTVIDIDGENALNVYKSKTKSDEIPTLLASTGRADGKGLHLYFRYAEGVKTTQNAFQADSGIDIRSEGGMVVAAPSRHSSGRQYKWHDFTRPTASIPDDIINIIRPVRRQAVLKTKKEDTGQYSLEKVEDALKYISNQTRETWRSIGIILGRHFSRDQRAWDLYVTWSSEGYTGSRGRDHEKIMHEAFHVISQEQTESELTIGTLIKEARNNGWNPGIKQAELYIYSMESSTSGGFVYVPTQKVVSAKAVDVDIIPILDTSGKPIKASDWLMHNRRAHTVGEDMMYDEGFHKDMSFIKGELVPFKGQTAYNLYRKPSVTFARAPAQVDEFLHFLSLNMNARDVKMTLDYFAHRTQRTWEKPRFALFFIGEQGVGKDTLIKMLSYAFTGSKFGVPATRMADLEKDHNEYILGPLVNITEVANRGNTSKWSATESLKPLISGGPDYVFYNPKYGLKRMHRMNCGVVMTSNHMLNSLHMTLDSRRMYVIKMRTKAEMGLRNHIEVAAFFDNLNNWFENGGAENLATFLRDRDISDFNPNNYGSNTAAHELMVEASEFVVPLDGSVKAIIEDCGVGEGTDKRAFLFRYLIDFACSGGYYNNKSKAIQDFNKTLIRLGYRKAHKIAGLTATSSMKIRILPGETPVAVYSHESCVDELDEDDLKIVIKQLKTTGDF